MTSIRLRAEFVHKTIMNINFQFFCPIYRSVNIGVHTFMQSYAYSVLVEFDIFYVHFMCTILFSFYSIQIAFNFRTFF